MPSINKLLQAAAGNAGGDNLYVEDVFSTYLYTGNGGTEQAIVNNVDLLNEGGLAWIKERANTGTEGHQLFDTERGSTYSLHTNTKDGNSNYGTAFKSFNSDGFSVQDSGYAVNDLNATYASWTFRKAEKFFDVVTYTGDSVAGREIAHNLGSVPGFMVVKSTSLSVSTWAVYHRSIDVSQYVLALNTTDAQFGQGYWYYTAPTSSVFTVGSGGDTNQSGQTYVAYLFAHDAGGFGDDGDESIITCGSFAHNYSGATVDCGFEPQWILVKAANQTNNWYIFDVMRGIVTGGLSGDGDAALFPNTSGAENVNTWGIDVNATGFTVYGNNILSSGNAIYIAIRRPMKTPESGTEVFNPTTAAAGTDITNNFAADLWFGNNTSGDGGNNAHTFASRLTGLKWLQTATTAAEFTASSTFYWDSNTEFTNSQFGGDRVEYFLKRATGFMDVVTYIGTGFTGSGVENEVSHNLAAIPEMMIIKNRDQADNWAVYHSALGPTKNLKLNLDSAGDTDSRWWGDTAPTDSIFSLGYLADVNALGENYIAYLFATLAGVSKVGSYTGTGSNVDVDCGFTAGARFILIKRTDSTGDWYTYDSARGISAGNDPYLLLNTTAAEVTGTDYVDPLSSGFTVTSSAPAGLNASGGTYIFLSIA